MQYAQRRSPGANAVGIGFVVLLHIGIGYGLLVGLGVMPRPVMVPHTEATVFVEPKKIDPLPEPQPQPLQPPELKLTYVPLPPDIQVDHRVPPLAGPTTSEPPAGPAAFHPIPAPAPAPEVYRPPMRIAGPALEYPARARLNEFVGWVDVECDVDETGRTSMCAVVAHEGSNMFVDAALGFVKATRYSPATRNGVAVTEAHHRFHIMFDLK